MKKYVMIAMALTAVVCISAFAMNKKENAEKAAPAFTDMYFIYQLDDVPVTDDHYEDDENWVFSASEPSPCVTEGSATCFIKVNSSELPSTGTETERLVQFLIDQDNEDEEFLNAREAVIELRQSTKLSSED